MFLCLHVYPFCPPTRRYASVDINAATFGGYKLALQFRGVRGAGNLGNLALDDVAWTGTGCEELVVNGGTCAKGTYVAPVGGAWCFKCDASCDSQGCTGPGSDGCINCPAGTFKDGASGPCQSTCPAMKFADPVTRTCKGCHAQCKEGVGCAGEGADQCDGGQCRNVKHDGACVAVCPANMWTNGAKVCVSCNPACLADTAGTGADCTGIGANHCNKCKDFLGMDQKTCAAACPSSGAFVDTGDTAKAVKGACKACDSLCDQSKGCSGTTPDKCDACATAKDDDGKTCIAACPTGKFNEGPDTPCKPCNAACSACVGSADIWMRNVQGLSGSPWKDKGCTKCTFAQFAGGDGTSWGCTTSCEDRYSYRDATGAHANDPICVPCDERCGFCTGSSHEIKAGGCTDKDPSKPGLACRVGKGFRLEDLCVAACPTGYTTPTTAEGVCKKEAGAPTCTTGQYSDGTQCQSCHAQCSLEKGCYGPGNSQCNACKTFQEGTACVAGCPDNTYASGTGYCTACHSNCDGTGCTGGLASDCNACKAAINPYDMGATSI